LAREALKHTPENVHFEPGAVFKWVRFPSPELEFDFPSSEVDHFPEFTNRVREELSKKYIVYAKQEDIPRELVTGDASRPEFVDGFLFSVTLRRLSPIRIEVKYHDYERYLGHGDALPRSTGRNDQEEGGVPPPAAGRPRPAVPFGRTSRGGRVLSRVIQGLSC
jgi:hypothetical protein